MGSSAEIKVVLPYVKNECLVFEMVLWWLATDPPCVRVCTVENISYLFERSSPQSVAKKALVWIEI